MTQTAAFEHLRSEPIASLNITLEEYRHRVTGAQYFHLANTNPENVFLVALRTVPMDSRGVAHILEHTALCGSRKFPVRDPFFMMIRRSLNTFMNAFTSSDWTAYPFASKNRKDFDNLMEVYLDAVFFSRLHELDFAQEGHRLEFTETENPDSELQFKGVVFNEMKGAMSSTNSILWQTLSRYLFPTTTYHYNSGGEPEDIPDLTYAQLKHFYETHYHPSNAIFMTCGDIPASEHMARFEELALKEFKHLDVHIAVQDEKRYLAPVKIQEFYPLEETDTRDKTHIVLAWLLGKSTDPVDMFEAHLLTSVLLDNSASPLMAALEGSELGKSPSPLCGLEDSNREMSFICGLEDCASDSTAAVEELVGKTLQGLAEQGVPQEQLEAALHQLELGQREISGDSYPYGLQLILTGLSTAIHRGDPVSVLNIDPILARLREQIRDPAFFPQLVRKHLLDNQHHLVLTMQPDPDLAKRQLQAEVDRLRAIRDQLSAEQKQQIILRSKALAARQEMADDPACLPKVGLEDIPKTLPELQAVTGTIATEKPAQTTPFSFYAQGTNGLCYQQIVVELPRLSDELLTLLPLYTSCLTEFGVGNKSYQEVQTWQSRISGGLNCYASVRSAADNEQATKAILVLSSKALQSNQDALSELLFETFHHVRFDESRRLREIADQIRARQESSITGRGHSLAMTLACSGFSPSAALGHRFNGLEGIRALKNLGKTLAQEETLHQLLDGFRQIHEQILQAPRQFLLIAEGNNQQALLEGLETRWQQAKAMQRQQPAFELPTTRMPVAELWTTNTQVNFCARAYPTVPASHPDHAILSVLGGFLRNGYLHRTIREQGGAYGGGADQDANSASFRFYSYRDPRLEATLQDYDNSIDWLLHTRHEWRHVEEAILGVISAMDKPSSPAGEAKQDFYNRVFGHSREQRIAFRERVLAVTAEDLQRVAADYLQAKHASTGVISSTGNAKTAETLGLTMQSL
ncbi:MAG: insulinase family protein [Pseudomonadales bacterium]|nr:insulinase family protein [Pseudomonadales bacterium]